jgi:SAM-dependent methyltransferase
LVRRLVPDGRVQSGPFGGMQFEGGKAEGSVLIPKLIGSYEEELHETIEECIATGYADVVDIGCDFGYYAIGFARRLPAEVRIFALDLNLNALRQCRLLADRNEVADQIVIEFGCTPAQLRELPARSPCLIICDCEGGENDLMQPQYLPISARYCDLLVEVHDLPSQPRMALELARRFAATHDQKVINGVPRAREIPDRGGAAIR